MKIVVSTQQMKELDSRTIKEFGIPSRVLMENAGKGCAELLHNSFSGLLSKGVVVICGYGNNGGDGYVIARWLDYYGYDVSILTVCKGNSSPETIANRDLCKKLLIEFIDFSDEDFEEFSEAVLFDAGVIIDAIYGINFKGKLNTQVAELIELVNETQALRVAIDIPSGVNADTGIAELAFHATLTLTMEAMKFGHLLGKGKLYSGIVDIIPIGIPDPLWENAEAAVLLDETVAHLPERNEFSHKGDYGRIAVFAGSPGFTGAAFLSSLAAVKAGAGLVTIFSHPEQMQIYDSKPYEVMVRAIPLQSEGKINYTALAETLDKYDVILFGPGCTVSEFTLQTLNFILNEWHKCAVIDADGLNTLAQHPELYAHLADKPIIITPHWGEFCRLTGLSVEDLEQNCLTQLKQFVEAHKTKVLLKSNTSIYYDTEVTYINSNGNDGLSTGGSGDVLSGLIAGFLAQRMCPANAAGMAAYYLGLTAERLAEKQETLSITPTDILDYIFKFEQEEDNLPDEE
jgi:hydroxyethylthiazole kinase-like uncharacterized protein yjeF